MEIIINDIVFDFRLFVLGIFIFTIAIIWLGRG